MNTLMTLTELCPREGIASNDTLYGYEHQSPPLLLTQTIFERAEEGTVGIPVDVLTTPPGHAVLDLAGGTGGISRPDDVRRPQTILR